MGSVDEISRLSKLSKQHGCWFHVDAAYGGFFILLQEMKHLFAGIEEADSLCLDPHKSLFQPYGCGIVLVKHREYLHKTFGYSSSLIDMSDNLNQSPADLSVELTRPFRGLQIWLPLLYHGVDTFTDALREKRSLVMYAYSKLEELEFIQLGPKPHLTVFVFRHNGKGIQSKLQGGEKNDIGDDVILNGLNMKLKALFEDDGRVYLTSTELDGCVWLRVAVHERL